ncbi:MAG: fibronectin type III domain-containing protein [Kiritimatiellaeota bacterium]|nr:fibronectin type III domain-containing protein [Kiritimatiellota bacterium]
MSNKTPQGYEPLIQLAEDAADGAHTHGAAIGLVHVNETIIRTALTGLIGIPSVPGGIPPAAPGLKELWNTAKANKSAKTAAVRTAQSNGRFLARMCIRSLAPVLGEIWNSAWNAAGFVSGSLAVPSNPLPMLEQLRAYYGLNPTHEVANVQGLACSAAGCEAAVQAISDAASASNQSNTDAGNAQKAFQAGFDLLYTTLSYLRNELDQLLDPDDERWYAFGFDKPSDLGSPTIPENVVVTAGAAGSKILMVHFDDGRNDESYRVTATNKATAEEITNVIVTESETTFTLDALAAGTLVDITVTGRNDKGETQPTEPITTAVP